MIPSSWHKSKISPSSYWKMDDNAANPIVADAVNSITPTSYWKMDDNAEDYVVTDSVKGLNGTSQQITSSLTTAGKINQALTFNGISDEIIIPNNSALSFTNGSHDLPFTISMWVNPSVLPGYAALISKAINESICEYEIGFAASYVSLTLFDNNYGAYNLAYTNSGILAEAWTNVVVTYDGSGSMTDGMAIYFNAVNQDVNRTTYSSYYVSMAQTSSDVIIGNRLRDGPNRFTGAMDDIKIFNKALSDTEVAHLYNSGSGVDETISMVGNNGTLQDYIYPYNTNVASVPGKIGRAINLGSLTYGNIVLSNFSEPIGTGNYSISLWFLTSTTTSPYSYIYLDYGSNDNNLIAITIKNTGNVSVDLRDNEGNIISITSNNSYNNGEWHFVAWSKSGTTSILNIDGGAEIIIGSNSLLGNIINNDGTPPIIGAFFDYSYLHLDGYIDDVKIFNKKALSDVEVKHLYNGGHGVNETDSEVFSYGR